jgi:hypothetical protein
LLTRLSTDELLALTRGTELAGRNPELIDGVVVDPIRLGSWAIGIGTMPPPR